jgi:hypothetical protein
MPETKIELQKPPYFWEQKALDELSDQEWESLCDGCGKCCLVKLEDEEDLQVYYTNVACQYLDLKTCRCKDYDKRLSLVPDCISLKPHMLEEFTWLPASCAYRLVAQGQELPAYHPLLSGSAKSMIKAKASVKGRIISECRVKPDDLEDHVITWVD